MVGANISLSLDAWTALDLMAVEDNVSVNRVLLRLVDAEAKRRMNAKTAAAQPVVEETPRKRKAPVLSEERKQALRLQAAHAREVRAQRRLEAQRVQ